MGKQRLRTIKHKNQWAALCIGGMVLLLFSFGFLGVAAQDVETATAVATPTPTDTPTSTPIPTPQPTLDGSALKTITGTLDSVTVQDIIEVAVSVVVIFLIAFYGGKLLYAFLQKLANRTKYELDDQLLEVIRPQISWLLLAIGFQFATTRLDFLDEGITQFLQVVYFLLYLFVILETVWRAGDFLVDWYITRNKEEMNQNLVAEFVPLLKRVSHIILILIAAIIAASYFGIDILALSTALGLSGFAIALAAKDTITNIISGFVLMISQPFTVEDRIDVASLGSWGEVVDIGIRSTTVVMRDNRLVIVPNSVIVDSLVVNYSRPDKTYRLQSDIGVGYGMNISEAQQLIKDTVRGLEGVLPDKPVDVWFTEFGESSMTFRVRWWVPTYADKRRSTDRVNAAIQTVALQENIDMPNPTYTLENKLMLSDEDIERLAQAVKALN